jgi:hypothetical protein
MKLAADSLERRAQRSGQLRLSAGLRAVDAYA